MALEGENKVETIKRIRKLIDEITVEVRAEKKLLDRNPGGRELALVVTKLEEAKMWAGKVLGELGHKLPEKYRDEA